MTQPTKPEPTQADREKVSQLQNADCENSSHDGCGSWQIECHDCLASELAAVREEAEKSAVELMECGHPKACMYLNWKHHKTKKPLKAKFCTACQAIEKAHAAGAAEMVERCRKFVWDEGEIDIYERMKELSPNPNYLAEIKAVVSREAWLLWTTAVSGASGVPPIPDGKSVTAWVRKVFKDVRAGVREECAKVSCWLCLQGYAVYRDESVKGSLIESAHAWKHRLSVSGVEKEEICGASKIRSLDPNHSDVVEGIRREAVWDSLDVDRMVCSRCESVGRISAIKLPHGIVMKCGQCCFKWILAQPRALLKEGE